MTTGKKIKVFFDSSVIIAGLASTKGASCMLLSLAEMEVIEPYICEQVVTEVIKNVEKKLPSCVPQFFTLFKKLPFIMVDATEDNITFSLQLINKKDAVILAAAITAGVDALITLDKHFLKGDLKEKLKLSLCTPGEFLRYVQGF